jgi:hypothetical protein
MQQMWIAAARRRKRIGRGAALAASVVFHAAVFVVAFSGAAGELVSAGDAGGGPVGPVLAVSLVRLHALTDAQEIEAAAELRPQFIKLRATAATDGIPVPNGTTSSQFAALADRLSARDQPASPPNGRFTADRVQPQGAYVTDEERASNARNRKARTDTGTDGETSNSASTGSLWGAIEPCWRNLGFRGQSAVTIELILDGKGGFGGPPTVVRNTTALLNEPRLKSEANALAALAACMPRGDVRMARQRFRLEFPATP